MYNLCYGMKVINISQLPQGSYSHPNNAMDLFGADSGVDFWFAQGRWKCIAGPWGAGTYFFAPVDENGAYAKVHCADGEDRIVTLALTHSYLKYVQTTVGTVYENGQAMYEEGTRSANPKYKVTGNHIHLEVAQGIRTTKHYDSSMGVYRMAGELNPLDVMFVNDGFSTVKQTLGAELMHCDSVEYKENNMGYANFGNLSAKTQAIVDAHKNDFDSATCKSYIASKGGYKAYIKSLGGVFAKYADFTGRITKASQMYEMCEYVFGLYAIWGVDYSNGSSFPNGDWKENRWKAYAGNESAFYGAYEPSARFKRNYASEGFGNDGDYPGIDKMLNPELGYYAITNCALGVVHVLKKGGLCDQNMVDPSEHPTTWYNKGYGYKTIKKQADLKAGDILIFSKSAIPNRDKVENVQNWVPWYFHTTIVSKVSKGKIYQFDSGHAYTQYGQPVHITKVGDKLYDWAADWIALRFDITDDLIGDGWYKSSSGKWYYYVNGVLSKGWKTINGKKYYFGDDGAMVTDLQAIDGKTYYFICTGSNIGQMRTGWLEFKAKGITRYFDDDGVMAVGLKCIGDSWYYFNEQGARVSGTETLHVKFGENGKMIGGTK